VKHTFNVFTKFYLLKKTVFLVFILFGLSISIDSCGKGTKETTVSDTNKQQKKGPLSPSFVGRVTLDEFPSWLNKYLKSREWKSYERNNEMTREVLEESLKMGKGFLINNQKPEGNFNYQYDFVNKVMDKNDNQVRQAGALWGLALIYQYDQDPKTKAALDKALKFFFNHTQNGPVEGSLLIAYPGDNDCKTGTVALVGVAIIDYLRSDTTGELKIPNEYREELTAKLNGYIEFLKFMRLKNGHFSSGYSLGKKAKRGDFNPYADGEALLCLIKAAKYGGYVTLISLIEDSALAIAKDYTVDQWQNDPDSPLTKGFFQWSCMAFWEYQDAGWKNSEVFGDYVLALSWWMVHTHRTLERTRNTAYAYEGIIPALLVAKSRQDEAAINDLSNTIDIALHKLTAWQVSGPLQSQNEFLMANQTNDPLAVGGIINDSSGLLLRIDVTQHQMHAVILALKYVYTN
jgi:UDP-N-acetylmuramoyl-tripeptide--D-alanyl-D-alanine ligase